MAAPIGKGDWVECIIVWRTGAPSLFRVGGLYCVEDIEPPGESCENCDGSCVGLSIAGIPDHKDGPWAGCCFRPIYRPRADFIQSLKAPPQHIRETEDA